MPTVNPDSPVILVHTNGVCGNGATIVRWYPDVWSAERNHVMLTVSASGTSIHTRYLEEIPQSWLTQAFEIRAVLEKDPFADLKRTATHKNSWLSNGPLVAVE